MTIELTTTAILLFSTFYGGPFFGMKDNKPVAADNMEVQSTIRTDQPLTLEQYVREYFKDTPIMAEIAKCESRFRHLGKNGKVLRGDITIEDLGIMQINEFFHEERAKKLGIDLHTLDGNLAYAKWLYGKEGTLPWYSSSQCWQKTDSLARMNRSDDSGGLARTDMKTMAN